MNNLIRESSKLYMSILPWIYYHETISFCGYELWDFYKEGPERVKSTQDMLYLAQFFSCIKDRQGNDVRSVFVAELRASRPTSASIKSCAWTVRALAFCFAVKYALSCIQDPNVARHSSFESERFQLSHYTIVDGMLYYLSNGVANASECAGKHFRLHQPEFLWTESSASPHRELMKIFEQFFWEEKKNNFESELWRRISLALDWYHSAFSGSPELKAQSKIIMLETAIEAITRQKNEDTRKHLCRRADHLCNWKKLRKLQPSNQSVGYSWLDQFIDGRNAFVHGGSGDSFKWSVESEGRQFHVQLVATIVLVDLIMGILEENKYIRQRDSLIRRDINKAYRTLGWL